MWYNGIMVMFVKYIIENDKKKFIMESKKIIQSIDQHI